jgi:hypothetical protein
MPMDCENVCSSGKTGGDRRAVKLMCMAPDRTFPCRPIGAGWITITQIGSASLVIPAHLSR